MPHDAAKTDGLNLGEGGRIQLSVQTASTHWLADAVHPFRIYHVVFGTDRFKSTR